MAHNILDKQHHVYWVFFFPLFAWLVEYIFLCSLDLHTVLENFLLETKEKESTLSLNTALFQFVNSYGKEANFS